MSADSGRRPVLATLNAAQVPQLGETSAMAGLCAGIDNALRLALCHSADNVTAFAAVLHSIRSGETYDINFCRAFASGYTLAASEVRRIGGLT